MTFVLLASGLFLLVFGAELLVKGASRLAGAVGISPLVVGLTVVAFGTSAPEMAVSVGAAWSGSADLAMGNVVGSNIFNVLFILGLSALITPLMVVQRLVLIDVPLMIAASVLVWLLARDGELVRWEGIVLFLCIISYTVFLIRQSRKENTAEVLAEYDAEFAGSAAGTRGLLIQGAFIIAGLLALVLGSRWLVEAAVTIARTLGVSELVIGLTIISIGTSLPEVATSVVASLRGERDIAVGNVIGSNLFNLLAVLGMSAAVSPAGIAVTAAVRTTDIPVMVGVAIICLPIFAAGFIISRWNGALLLGLYLSYLCYLIFDATQASFLQTYIGVMLQFVVPVTAFALLMFAIRHFFEGDGNA